MIGGNPMLVDGSNTPLELLNELINAIKEKSKEKAYRLIIRYMHLKNKPPDDVAAIWAKWADGLQSLNKSSEPIQIIADASSDETIMKTIPILTEVLLKTVDDLLTAYCDTTTDNIKIFAASGTRILDYSKSHILPFIFPLSKDRRWPTKLLEGCILALWPV